MVFLRWLVVSPARAAILQLGKSTVLETTKKPGESTIETGSEFNENDIKSIFRRISMKSLFSIIVSSLLVTLVFSHMYKSPNGTATLPSQSRLRVEITQGITLPVPHTRHTVTRLLNGRILLVGGYSGESGSLAEVDLFDPMNGSIIPVATLHTARHDHSATLLRDARVLVVGGYNPQQGWLADAEVYDPFTDTWTVVPPLYSHGVGHTATLLKDGRVLVVGGGISSGVCTERAEIFDPQTNSWIEAPSLPAQRNGHTANLFNDGRVLIAGGVNATGLTIGGDAFLYDPKANNWTVTTPMVKQRAYAGSVQLKDGRVLVAGGIAADGSSVWHMIANTEIYDPASNTWSATASLSDARYAYILSPLPDGQVLAVGGTRDHDSNWGESSFVREVEVYDPNANGWQTVGEIPQPGAFAAAALFHDGHLWVTGGYDGPSGQSISQATWIIAPIHSQP
jgi:N-acetylneuraminic acid mutarotase